MNFEFELHGYSTILHHSSPKRTFDSASISVWAEDMGTIQDFFQQPDSGALPDFRLTDAQAEPHWVSGFLDNNSRPALTLFSIQERKTKELEMEETGERLALVLEGTRLGMWDWNPQTNDVVFDERWAQMLGHELSEIEFALSSWESRVHPDDIASCFADITAHMEGKIDFYENVHRMKHKAGHWVYILDRGKIARRDPDGNPVRFTGTHTDITREKRAEQKALEASRAKDFFLAQMSHEIRTPLHGILGFVDLLRRSGLSEEQAEYLEIVTRSSNSLLTILNDILDISRAEAGKLTIQNSVFDVRRTIQDAFLLFQESAIRKNLHYDLKIENNLVRFVEGDENRIRQVLGNLLNNAVKFTESGSIILNVADVSSNETEPRLRFEIADTGPGIAVDQTSRVFEKFSQIESSTSRSHGGTGLGLPISKQLVELMGGDLNLESKPGIGSTFTVELPLRRSEGRKTAASTGQISFKNVRVLVADDDELNQLLLRKFLGSMQVEASMVSNGEEVLEQLDRNPYDMLLLDLHMPVMNGMETMRALKDKGNKLPYIVALTADAYQETKSACLEAGMDDFLAKPYSFDQVSELIARRVGQR